MGLLGWAVILLAIGLALAILEFFVPSGGVIGFLAALAVIAAIVMAFVHDPRAGLAFMAVTAVVLPAGLAVALQIWPRTPLGKRILLDVPRSEEVLPDPDQRQQLRSLVGRVGRAKSIMLPGGVVVIDDRQYEAISEGMAIEPGQHVKVLEVRGSRLLVRATDERPGGEGLDRPIDFDPFERPVA
jgi:membrane-bound ClpP family serine protease